MAKKRKRVKVPKRSFVENVKETAKLLKELRQQKRNIARDLAASKKKKAAQKRLKQDVAESKKSPAEKKKKTGPISVKAKTVEEALRRGSKTRMEELERRNKRKK